MAEKRFFVPLSTIPFEWFKGGHKTWELRHLRGGFNLSQVRPGRRVELRRGYSTSDSIFGTIDAVLVESSLRRALTGMENNFFKKIIPIAKNLEEAIVYAKLILKIEPDAKIPIIAFQFIPE